jgi:uncharacterized protein YpuA (DUF1002 family)
MFWLIKKIVFWGIFIGVVIWVLNMPYNGRPLKTYLTEFYESPIVKEGIRFTKTIAKDQLDKFYKDHGEEPMETLSNQDRKELDAIIEQNGK